MKTGIIGLPQVGKTSLFKILTKAHVEGHAREAHLGVAKVPDSARVRGSDGRERHGDTAIALVLAMFAALTMEPVKFEYQRASGGEARFSRSKGTW